MKDLIILVSDKNMYYVLDALLQRHKAFQIKPIEYDIYIHPLRDPGVYQGSADFLRSFLRQYRFTLVFLDREGSGKEKKDADEIAEDIITNLKRNGWEDRCEVIVFDPELETWAWINSPYLAKHTGWENLSLLQDFLRTNDYWEMDLQKPLRPKEAFEAALREKRVQRSSAIYKNIASDAGFQDCIDPSFKKFHRILKHWFSVEKNR